LGGFDLAFESQGFIVKWQVEIDKNCQKLLKAKCPHAELHTDLTKFKPKDSDAVSVICGGTPCQDLSVAGQRECLDGERSGLFFDMVRLCKKLRPRIIEWENVPGALSSNEGRDFARVIRAFTGLKVEIPREGWGNAGFVRTPHPGGRWNIAWRVLDAQYFGVAQRRKRLFLIGSLGNASCLQILFEPESVCGDNPPSREKRERTTAEFESSTNGGGGGSRQPARRPSSS
jgi:DNA (cytosine-5)-methyltransferase 1